MYFICRRNVVGNLAEAEQRKDGDKTESSEESQCMICVNVTAEMSIGNWRS